MDFDCIVGNPPYQEVDNIEYKIVMGASPIYQFFVESAKVLGSKYVSLIIPARWIAGEGRGLYLFSKKMLFDSRLHTLFNLENSKKFFTDVNIAGGICIFLLDRDKMDTNICYGYEPFSSSFSYSNSVLMVRDLFVRDPRKYSICEKINKNGDEFLDSQILGQAPFGLCSNVRPCGSNSVGGGG